MNRTCYILATQSTDSAFDLPPVAEVDDIPDDPAAVGAGRGFAARRLPERGDQPGSVGERGPIREVEIGRGLLVHSLAMPGPACGCAYKHRQRGLHQARRWRDPPCAANASGMATRNTQAGGALLAGGSIIGTFAGAAFGQPSAGLLAGLGTGALAAIVVWLRDRKVR